MRNEFQKHKRSDKIKWALTAFTLFLLSLVIVGMCLQLFGKGKVKPSEWFKNVDTKVEQSDENSAEKDIANSTLSLSITPLNAASDNSIVTVANESPIATHDVQASASPTNVQYSAVYWDLSWKSSSVSDNISDYVKIVETDDGSDFTRRLECYKAFGNQMILTFSVVSTDGGTTKSATCTVDYRKRVTNLNQIELVLGEKNSQTYTNSGAPIRINMYDGSASRYRYYVGRLFFTESAGSLPAENAPGNYGNLLKKITLEYVGNYSLPSTASKTWTTVCANNTDGQAPELEFYNWLYSSSVAPFASYIRSADDYVLRFNVTFTCSNDQEFTALFYANFNQTLSSADITSGDIIF